jgi:VanZ family protein
VFELVGDSCLISTSPLEFFLYFSLSISSFCFTSSSNSEVSLFLAAVAFLILSSKSSGFLTFLSYSFLSRSYLLTIYSLSCLIIS